MKAKLTGEQGPKKTTATLEIDGRTFELKYSTNAICDAEREAGCSLLTAMIDFAGMSVIQLRALLCACIRGGDPMSKMTVKEAGDLVKYETIFAITNALAEAMLLSAAK